MMCLFCLDPTDVDGDDIVFTLNGEAVCSSCGDKEHDFYSVVSDGYGAYITWSKHEAEIFLQEELDNLDPDSLHDFTIERATMTGREYAELGEFDGW